MSSPASGALTPNFNHNDGVAGGYKGKGGASGSNSDQWYFSQHDIYYCPSFLDGLKQQEIEQTRLFGYRLISEVGKSLNFDQRAIATAMLFFQRFYQFHSMRKYRYSDIGTTCLFITSKVEEVRGVHLRECVLMSLKYNSVRKQLPCPSEDSEEFKRLKSMVLRFEYDMFVTLNFDIVVEHPYEYIVSNKTLTIPDGIKRVMIQSAWIFVNDSLITTLCLEYPPKIIAITALFMGAKHHKVEVHWPDFKIDDTQILMCKEVYRRIVTIYQNQAQNQPQNQASPPSSSMLSPSPSPTSSPPFAPSPNPQPTYSPKLPEPKNEPNPQPPAASVSTVKAEPQPKPEIKTEAEGGQQKQPQETDQAEGESKGSDEDKPTLNAPESEATQQPPVTPENVDQKDGTVNHGLVAAKTKILSGSRYKPYSTPPSKPGNPKPDSEKKNVQILTNVLMDVVKELNDKQEIGEIGIQIVSEREEGEMSY